MALDNDSAGNVYVTGSSWRPSADYDYATVKYWQARRGDVNHTWVIDIEDIVYLNEYVFYGGPSPIPVEKIGDCNCGDVVDVGDVVWLINYVFYGGPEVDCWQK